MTDKQRRQLLGKAITRLKKTKEGYHPEGGHWRAAMSMLNELQEDLEPDQTVIGPVQKEGVSLLKLSLTHETSGLSLYPAVDTAFDTGVRILAPEPGKVTRHSGSDHAGYSVYFTGISGLRYYFTHLDEAGRAPIGALKTGGKIGVVGSPKKYPGARVAHCHLGVNIEDLPGCKGKQLKYGKTGKGPNYTFGSPPIGKQLAALKIEV